MNDQFAGAGDLPFGRRAYRIFAAHWPHVDSEGAGCDETERHAEGRRLPTLDRVERNNSTLLPDDAGEADAGLKRERGGVIVV